MWSDCGCPIGGFGPDGLAGQMLRVLAGRLCMNMFVWINYTVNMIYLVLIGMDFHNPYYHYCVYMYVFTFNNTLQRLT